MMFRNDSWTSRLMALIGLAALCIVSALKVSAETDSAPKYFSIADQVAQWESSTRQAEELKQSLLIRPEEEEKWNRLLWLLQSAADRDLKLAHFARQRDWAPQLDLQLDLEARQENERLQWATAAAAANPYNSGFQLNVLDLQTSSEASFSDVEVLAKKHPSDVRLAFCLALAFEETQDVQLGADFLASFVSNHPDDPNAWQAQIDFLQQAELEDEYPAALEERARRFPEEPRFRLELMEAIAGASEDDQQLRPWLAGLEGKAGSLLEQATFCEIVHENAWGDDLGMGCFRRTWKLMKKMGLDSQPGATASHARSWVLKFAKSVGDWDWELEVLEHQRDLEAVESWGLAFDYGDEPQACGHLLFALASGHFGDPQPPLEVDPWDWSRHWKGLADSLETCDIPEEANRIRLSMVKALPTPFLDQWSGATALATAELVRRYRKQPENLEVLRVVGENPERFPDLPREEVLRAWAERSDSFEPALKLASLLRSQGRFEEEEETLDLALRQFPTNLDLHLWRAGAAFNAGKTGLALDLASSLLRDRQASPRQHATARYLLGRVARREGRMKEATNHLAQYFLLRFTYAGCCQGGADTGFLAHLRQTAEPEQISAYLAAKTKALLAYHQAAKGGPFEGACDQLSCDTFADPKPNRTRSMEKISRSSPAVEFTKAYLADILEKRERWKRYDPEMLFDDDEVLGFDPANLGPPRGYSASTRCGPVVRRLHLPFGTPYTPWSQYCPW